MPIRNDKMESHTSQRPADTGYVLSRRRFLRHTILSSGAASLPLTLLPEGWSWDMKPMRKCRIHGGLWWVHADMRTANETFWREQGALPEIRRFRLPVAVFDNPGYSGTQSGSAAGSLSDPAG
ncbi:MAG: hypothetical protein UZ16_OP3001003456 [Candidatus Hinthialibacteria bacterium OLB16]|nr:MAG: hypothetical protein UZ16_OP3001003456 [Candidatus Hinthialibacteria bacterium OLB16]